LANEIPAQRNQVLSHRDTARLSLGRLQQQQPGVCSVAGRRAVGQQQEKGDGMAVASKRRAPPSHQARFAGPMIAGFGLAPFNFM
jgi:hypothetical protein